MKISNLKSVLLMNRKGMQLELIVARRQGGRFFLTCGVGH